MKTCLVVDDSRVIRKVAGRILEELGYAVAEAEDGAEALAWCKSEMPDAVLLDWNMPVMNGLDFLRELRSQPRGISPVVVMCSVHNEPRQIEEAIGAGADEYIMKPFDGDIIAAKFAEAGL